MSEVPKVMRVPLFAGDGEISWHDKPILQPGPGQLLIQVKANALCGSERGQFHQGSIVTPGHEAAGIVAASGPNTHVPVGAPGVIFLMGYCGACENCRHGYTNQCLHKKADMGFSHDGGYGPFELIDEILFFPIDPDIDFAEATMLLDIMGTGGHAIARGRLVRPDVPTLLVTGAGPIGLGVLAMAKLLLGVITPVFIADTNQYRLELAEKLGGIPVDLQHTTIADILALEGHMSAAMAIDTSGKQVARETCIAALDKRGALVCVGHGEGISLDVSRDLIAPERAVLGSEYFRFDEFVGNLALMRKHIGFLRQIITHRFGIEELQHAFEVFFDGNTGKVVVTQ